MKTGPALAPVRWRIAYALLMPLYMESLLWLPRLISWLFGAPLAFSWPLALLIGVPAFLLWFRVFPRPSVPRKPERTPHLAAVGLGLGMAAFVAVTGAFLTNDLPAAAHGPAALALGAALGLVSAAMLYAATAIHQRWRAAVAQLPSPERRSA